MHKHETCQQEEKPVVKFESPLKPSGSDWCVERPMDLSFLWNKFYMLSLYCEMYSASANPHKGHKYKETKEILNWNLLDPDTF